MSDHWGFLDWLLSLVVDLAAACNPFSAECEEQAPRACVLMAMVSGAAALACGIWYLLAPSETLGDLFTFLLFFFPALCLICLGMTIYYWARSR